MLETNLVEKIFQHFLRILRQSDQGSEQELLLLLDILETFLSNCETNVSPRISLASMSWTNILSQEKQDTQTSG